MIMHIQEKNLKGDIETLESFYKDRGYIKFSIESLKLVFQEI